MSCNWCEKTTPAMHTVPATACESVPRCPMDCESCNAPMKLIDLCDNCCPQELKAVPQEVIDLLTKE